jgi:transposase
VGWLRTLAGPVRTTYEAGPTGYGLARALEGAGVACLVAAPSRIPPASGERVKSDARDAGRLARLLRAGELVAVAVPTMADEGARDWCGPARTPAPI